MRFAGCVTRNFEFLEAQEYLKLAQTLPKLQTIFFNHDITREAAPQEKLQ